MMIMRKINIMNELIRGIYIEEGWVGLGLVIALDVPTQ